MAFLLIPENGESVMINAWNWRPTIELLRDAKLIDEDLYERMGTFGREANVDAGMARRFADFIDLRLQAMKPDERIGADLTTTDGPKKRVIFTSDTKLEDIDVVDLYSTKYEWLIQFSNFCRTCGGFKVS
jgi:hypothetical protein